MSRRKLRTCSAASLLYLKYARTSYCEAEIKVANLWAKALRVIGVVYDYGHRPASVKKTKIYSSALGLHRSLPSTYLRKTIERQVARRPC